MDGWDWALLAFAAYVAIMGLARLMARRRESLVAQLRQQAQQQQAQEPREQPEKKRTGKSA